MASLVGASDGIEPLPAPSTTIAPAHAATHADAAVLMAPSVIPGGDVQGEGGALVTEELLNLAENMRTIVPQGTWISLGSEAEVVAESGGGVIPRPLMQLQFDVTRSILLRQRLGQTGFITKEASEDSRDLRGVRNSLYTIMRDEVDVAVQAVPDKRHATTQSYFARQVDASVQADPVLVDACIHHMDVPKKENPKLMSFLQNVLPRTMHYLTQNAEVPIYIDDYALFKEDDAIVGTRDDTMLAEKGNYKHAATKDRRITCISWRSGRGGDDCVCVTSIAPYSLEERIEAQKRCENSFALVWEFSDPMHPRYILESPSEVQVLHFSPSMPNLIAGGAMNGQVYLWDLHQVDRLTLATETAGEESVPDAGSHTRSLFVKEMGDIPPVPLSVKGVELENDGDVLVPRLQPIQSSRIELSHRRPVHDLRWLPDNLECTFDGKQVVVKESHQFATVSDDGIMCIWDTRPEHLPTDKLRKMKHQGKGGVHEAVWVPLHKYYLTKLDGSGDVMGFRFFFDGLRPDGSPSHDVVVGSTDGELATCCMVTSSGRHSSQPVATFGNTKDMRFVRSVVSAHAGPVYSVQRHPQIGDVYLTCGDYSFKVWRAGVSLPLFRSPRIESSVTCAAWSPTRPALVFIGTGDGKIVVWDILDSNSDPLLSHHLVQDAVTSIAFKPVRQHAQSSKSGQHMAVGTNLGSFHWYTLPVVLSKAPNGELRQFRAMLEREVRRAAYFQWRWEERQQEMNRYGANAPTMAIKPSIGVATHGSDGEEVGSALQDGGDNDFDNLYNRDPQRDAEFLAAVEEFRKLEEARMKMDAL